MRGIYPKLNKLYYKGKSMGRTQIICPRCGNVAEIVDNDRLSSRPWVTSYSCKCERCKTILEFDRPALANPVFRQGTAEVKED